MSWLRNRLPAAHGDYYSPRLGDDGLMFQDTPSTSTGPGRAGDNAVQAVAVRGKGESLEKLQAGFDRLIDELSGINDHLRRQVSQHEELITRVDQLPKLLESFPSVVENQKVLTEQLIGQLKANLLKDAQMLAAVEKIPAESARQTDALVNIDRQLAASADVDVQMTETFNKFNESLGKLNESTQGHTDGVAQMSRTFAASDRYLKFIVTRQTRQFMWVFYSALAVCVVVILALVGIIIYLAR
ncbi:MAG: hypothetical protein MUO27_09870 [Sedimentisphaerales bacterium]|nr:hypothetical protein [Sedimentisphaerales bacterium]